MAFPAISAGAYGWEVDDVARIAVDAVRRWAASRSPDQRSGERAARSARRRVEVELVRFVLFGDRAHSAFVAALTG